MRCGEIPAVKIEVILLLAVIGQRLARNLSSGYTSPVGEYREEQGIHAGTLLKHIQDSFSPFVDKRNCSHLNANHFGGHSTMSWNWHRQGGAGTRGNLQEFATIYVKRHGLFLLSMFEPMPKRKEFSFVSRNTSRHCSLAFGNKGRVTAGRFRAEFNFLINVVKNNDT